MAVEWYQDAVPALQAPCCGWRYRPTSVWEIFWAMKPLLPTPVNRMVPLHSRHARQNLSTGS